jgi:hypothetical protein
MEAQTEQAALAVVEPGLFTTAQMELREPQTPVAVAAAVVMLEAMEELVAMVAPVSSSSVTPVHNAVLAVQ